MNNIIIELSAEDRARIDRLTAALEARIAQEQTIIEKTYDKAPEKDDIAEMARAALDTTKKTTTEDTPKIAQDEQKLEEVQTPNTTPEEATEAEEPSVAPVEEAKPAVTLEMLRNKALALSAAGKKDQVRAIVTSYAGKISDISESQYGEVYAKLTELEG